MSSGGIAPKAHACVGRFDELCQLLPESDDSARATLIDQLGRFKIWAGNIGAFQELPTPSSLEHRLRDAPKIGAQVAEFLDDLEETLHEVLSIVSGNQPNRVSSSHDAVLEDTTTEDRDEDAASVESSQSQTSSELEELLRSSGDTITSLFKLSVLIRSATTRDRYAKAAKSQGLPFDPHFDIGHVGHKFPRVHQTSWLEKRLGKAMTQRRLFLRYCRQHRDRLETHHMSKTLVGDAIPKDRLASALGEGSDDISQAVKSHVQSTKAPSTQAITTASTLIVNNLDRLEDTFDELQSQTSYVTSANENDSSCIIRIPPIPDEGFRGLPFECPYCWNLQLIRNRRDWKRHVLHDLKPYVCTFEECDLKMFADRRSWFHHEMQAHRIEWCCPFCSNVPFSSFKSFENHLQSRHAQTFPNDQLRALAETCQQSVNKIPPQDCPFCVEWSIKLRDINPGFSEDSIVVTPAQFQHHVGAHMEQLALFALPRDHVDAVDSTGAAASHGEKSDSFFRPQASFAKRDNPPLHVAAFEGLETETLRLLRDGAMVDSAGETWGDALTAAVAGRHASVVEILLDHGATFSGASSYGFEAILLATENGDEKIVHILRESAAKTGLKEQVGSEFVDEVEETLSITTEHLVSGAKEDGNSLSLSIDNPGSPQKCLETVATQAYSHPQQSSIERAGNEKSEFGSRDGEPTPEIEKSVFELIIKLTGASIRMDERLRALAPHADTDALKNLISQLELMTGTLKGIKRQLEGDAFMVIVPDSLKPILLDIHRTLGKLDLFLKGIPTLQDGWSSWRRVQASITSSGNLAQVESLLKANLTDLIPRYRKIEQDIAIRWMPLDLQRWIFDQLEYVEDLAGDTLPKQDSLHPLIGLLVGLHSRDSENRRLPYPFKFLLGDQIKAVLRDASSQWYKDAHARQSLEAFLEASLEPSFWKRMDDGSIDHLLLFFAACATHVVNKATLLDDQLWRPIVDEQLAKFMSLISAMLENHTWARDRPEFTIHLNRLEHRLRMSTFIDGNIGVSKKLHGSDEEGNDGTIFTETAIKLEASEDVLPSLHKWLYLDLGRKLRGPWSDWQMYEWYVAGLLPDELQVREVEETDFGPLSQFVEKIKRSTVPENIVPTKTPPGLVNVIPQKTAGTVNLRVTRQDVIRFLDESDRPHESRFLISQRVVDVQQFFVEVLQMGGSAEVTAKEQWGIVAASLGFPTKHCHSVIKDLRSYWDLHLSEYAKSFDIWQEEQRRKSFKSPNIQRHPTSQISTAKEGVSLEATLPKVAPPINFAPEFDDPTIFIAPNTVCRRRGCNELSTTETNSTREGETCFCHSGRALYHEESRWWTCCNIGISDSDVFTEIEGCMIIDRHLFVGSEYSGPSTAAPTHNTDVLKLSDDDLDHADNQIEANTKPEQRTQSFHKQRDSDEQFVAQMQEIETLHHTEPESATGATSLRGSSTARQGDHGDLNVSISPELQLTKFPSSISPYSPQSFGPSAPEGYRYQCSDCTGRRKALLIGIESPEIQNTFEILQYHHRYEEADIVTLSSQPTKRAILSAMTWLVKDAQTNDSLFFQYSGPVGQRRDLDTHGRPTFNDVILPIDFKTAGHITNYEMFQTMVQPLRPGVRLTAIFDEFYKASPLNVAYIYSAQAVLAGADFRTKASQSVVAYVSSNARKLLRAMSSSKSLEAPELSASDIQDLSRVTGTSPADVVVFHAARHAGLDTVNAAKWSTTSAFFHVYKPYRRDSYAELLSNMYAQVPFNSTINLRINCCHPLDMNKRFIM